MIQIKNLTFSYGEKPLYENVNITISKGQKVGLVGPNGSGKSTLLSIITGKENGYTGNVVVLGSAILVPQEIKHDPIMESSVSVREYIDKEFILEDHDILKIFSGLELTVSLDANPNTLSGGQKTKLALARALVMKPDTLLLDEPTNFMDKAGKSWVMRFLSDYEGGVIVISHDLDLMNKKIDKVLAVNPYSREIEEYKGNYTDYIRLKKQKDENLRKQVEIKTRHLKSLEKAYTKLYTFDAKRSVARRRIERERAALPELPPDVKSIKIKLPEPQKVGELVFKAVNLSKDYGNLSVLKDVNLSLLRNERMVLVGPNGSGKSTLIKTLTGNLAQTSGSIYKDSNLNFGYYSQEFESFNFSKTVLDTFVEQTEKDAGFARAFLGRYMLSGDKSFQTVGSLSGGEKTRLSIAILTGKQTNLLILDEPTTYLDVLSQRIILESLKEYKGTMILVSHTPEFVKEIKPTKAFLFPEEKMVIWDDDILNRIGEL